MELVLKYGDKEVVVPIKPNDTSETLSQVLQKNGFDPSNYSKEISDALSQASGPDNQIKNFSDSMTDEGIKIPDNISQLKNMASTLDPTSKEYKNLMDAYQAERDDFLKLNPTLNTKALKTLPAGAISDIQGYLNQQSALKNLLKLKSTGFSGTGVDTGPLVGGAIPIPFSEREIPLTPASISQFASSLSGDNEESADRSRLRRSILSFGNPVRKEVTGAGASVPELQEFIFPSIPTESDQDLAFYQKGLDAAKESQQKLVNTLKALENAKYDVSGFKGSMDIAPEDFVDQVIETISQRDDKAPLGSFSFPETMSDTYKSFLQRKLQKQKPQSQQSGLKPTHRFNPQTGQVEEIQ